MDFSAVRGPTLLSHCISHNQIVTFLTVMFIRVNTLITIRPDIIINLTAYFKMCVFLRLIVKKAINKKKYY